MKKRNIYLIQNTNTKSLKIGIGKSPEKRVKQLQTGNEDTLVVFYQREINFCSKVETVLHKTFAPFHKRGEWFELPHDFSYALFDDLVTLYENNFISLKENPFI